MSTHETDDAPDVTRITRRVHAALNSGRDAAVVEVVLDETATLRADNQVQRTARDAWRKIAMRYEAERNELRAQVARVEALADKLQRSAIPGMTKWDYGQDIRDALEGPR